MDKRCKGCKNFYTSTFCSYISEECLVYGTIDCNPSNVLNTMEGPCPMYNKDKIEYIIEAENIDFSNFEPFKDF